MENIRVQSKLNAWSRVVAFIVIGLFLSTPMVWARDNWENYKAAPAKSSDYYGYSTVTTMQSPPAANKNNIFGQVTQSMQTFKSNAGSFFKTLIPSKPASCSTSYSVDPGSSRSFSGIYSRSSSSIRSQVETGSSGSASGSPSAILYPQSGSSSSRRSEANYALSGSSSGYR